MLLVATRPRLRSWNSWNFYDHLRALPSWAQKSLREHYSADLLVQVKLFWQRLLLERLAFRSFPFQVQTLSKCLWVLARREFAICLAKLGRTLPVLSLLMKLTPLLGLVVKVVSLVETMSAKIRSTSCWWRWMALTPRKVLSSLLERTDWTFLIRLFSAQAALIARSKWISQTSKAAKKYLMCTQRNLKLMGTGLRWHNDSLRLPLGSLGLRSPTFVTKLQFLQHVKTVSRSLWPTLKAPLTV
mmetsp:Transcript_19896/g.36935  ORF Transcript_19896/g.36935 Transcript_19896/m.36935 type:complete len:243 (+) Transcript_19896:1032-1760(+)